MAAIDHHAQDLGKILVQAQADLRQIRESLGEGGSTASQQRLQAVVEKAEADLQLKAEAVLNSISHSNVSTLPALGSYNFSSSRNSQQGYHDDDEGSSQARARLRLPARNKSAGPARPKPLPSSTSASLAQRGAQRGLQRTAMLDPTSDSSRRFLEQRFGIEQPAAPRGRPVGKQRGEGKPSLGLTVGPVGLIDPSVRKDPQAKPPIGEKDVAAGLYSLVNRGLLPSHVDLTPALARQPAPIAQSRAPMHESKDQFATQSSAAYTSPFGFNMTNTKLDLLSDVGETLAEKRVKEKSVAAMARARADASISSDVQLQLPDELAQQPVTLRVQGAPAGSAEAEAAAAEAARGFDELMDTFSLHHFIIRNGATLVSTPEFVSFERKYATEWGAINQLVRQLEQLFQTYSVPLAYVDGQKLVNLARDPLAPRDQEALLECIVNAEQVSSCLQLKGNKFRAAESAERLAVVELQSAARVLIATRRTRLERERVRAAMLITRRAKARVTLVRASEKLAEMAEQRLSGWRKMMSTFQQDWPSIKNGPRVILHLPSLSFSARQRVSMPNLDVRQNGQMPRLCSVREPGVDVLYVAPFPLNDDVSHYYKKVLEIGGIDSPEKRFKVIVPENYHRFPPHFSLTTMLLYSPRALRRIANFSRGRRAYIVPNVVGPEELRLSMALRLPLLAPEPKVAAIFGTKSGAKRIFQAAQVNTPPGAHDIYDEKHFYSALAQLICTHLDVPRWVFKLDDETGGRGCAYFDVYAMPGYKVLLAEHDADPEEWYDPAVQVRVRQLVQEELEAVVPDRAVLNMKWLWRSWKGFLDAMARSGGVIEASPLEIQSSPSANLFLEPDGTLSLTSTHEQIFSSTFTFVGAAFPQQSVPFAALREAALAIGKECYDRGVIGHVGVDFVAFTDAEGLLRVWAVDLNLRLTHTALSFSFFDFLIGGSFDNDSGEYFAPISKGESSAPSAPSAALQQSAASSDLAATAPDHNARASLERRRRTYVMNELMYHPQLPYVHHSAFFNMCRLKGISFDLVERTGTVFNLMDSFAAGTLGVLTTGRSLLDSLRKFADCLDFIQKQVGPATTKLSDESHETQFADVITAIKTLADKRVRLAAQAKLAQSRERAAASLPNPEADGTPRQEPSSRYLKSGVTR